MIETIVNDVSGILRATFLTNDWIALVIAFGSVLVGALLMQRSTQIGSMTILALVVFVLGGFLRGVFSGSGAAASNAHSQLEASWLRFMDMQAGTLLAYFLAFMLLILVLYGVKAILSRG